MFSVNEVICRFGDRTVLRNVSFSVEDGEKLAIVGANGSGKSTLLQIIAGGLKPDSGSVVCPKSARIGYLPQEAQLDSRRTLNEELLSVFKAAHKHLAEMARLEAQMAQADGGGEFDRIARRYDFLQGEIQRLDAYTMEAQAAQTAAGLGFSADDLTRRCNEFSGGWRTRVVLAKVLLGRPDILLLDEPTNHLDLETMLWLEGWIRASRACVAMVSHERAFMDRLAHETLELANGEATLYHGNYTDHLAQRKERRLQQQRAYDNQQLKIREIGKFIARFRCNASKAALVQSRILQLGKIKRLKPPPPDPNTIHFEFPHAERANKEVIVLEGASKAYGERQVLKPFDLTVYRGDRIAALGLNGAGKSTLLRMLAGVEPLSSGRRIVGSKVRIEHFEQFEADSLSSDRTVVEEMLSAAPVTQSGDVRDLLGAFLFRGNDVDRPARVLSGGERTRLRLAKMLFSRANCLILDEPTNHLDLASRLTLEHALRRFSGSLVLVSHDRVFLDQVANKIVEVRDGSLRVFPGNYTDYLNATNGQGFLPTELADSSQVGRQSAEPPRAPRPSRSSASRPDSAAQGERRAAPSTAPDAIHPAPSRDQAKAQRMAEREARKAQERQERKRQRELEKAEKEAAELEEALEAIHMRMAEPQNAVNPALMRELVQQQKETQSALQEAYAEWERRAGEMDREGPGGN